MRTLQEQYNAIKNGNGNKAQFLKQARHLFPQYVNQYSDFDTASNVLKSKQIISEAAGGVVSKGFDIWDWKKILNEYGEDSGGQDMTWGRYKDQPRKLKGTNQDFVDKGKEDFYDDVPFEACPYESGYNKYYKADLAKLWQMGWKKAEAEDKGTEFIEDEPNDNNLDDQSRDYDEVNLTESVKSVEKETSKEVLDNQKNAYNNSDMKNADNVNFNEIMKGFYAELKDEKNKEKSGDEIKAMVVKNLAKDPLYYTKNGEFGVKDLGYTTEAPGLGEPKEPKGKHKSSGYGDLKEGYDSKAGLSKKEQELRSLIQQIIKEELDNNNPAYLAKYIAGGFEDYIIPGSEKFTYGPDEEGTYHLEFQLGFDSLSYDTPEDEEEELQNQIGGRSSGGPGQAFSRTYVSYEGEKNGIYIFDVHQRGGYDI